MRQGLCPCKPWHGEPRRRDRQAKLNLEKMMGHKDAVVKSNVEGVAYLFKKNKIDSFIGTGKVLGEGKVSVTGDDGKTQELEPRMW
jgi:dihydrolipoamide dehydrogenase